MLESGNTDKFQYKTGTITNLYYFRLKPANTPIITYRFVAHQMGSNSRKSAKVLR